MWKIAPSVQLRERLATSLNVYSVEVPRTVPMTACR